MQLDEIRYSRDTGAMTLHGMTKTNSNSMKSLLAATLLTAALFSGAAHARNDLSTVSVVSALPLASLAVPASAAADALVAIPVALSTAGSTLVVRSVQASAHSTVYVFERASDGAKASVEVAHRIGQPVSVAVGTAVTVSVLGAGIVLSVGGEAIAFIPNAMGRALLHNERMAF